MKQITVSTLDAIRYNSIDPKGLTEHDNDAHLEAFRRHDEAVNAELAKIAVGSRDQSLPYPRVEVIPAFHYNFIITRIIIR
jgi:hypothetical protein